MDKLTTELSRAQWEFEMMVDKCDELGQTRILVSKKDLVRYEELMAKAKRWIMRQEDDGR